MNRFVTDGMMQRKLQDAAIAASESIHPHRALYGRAYKPKNTSKPKRERVKADEYPFHPLKV